MHRKMHLFKTYSPIVNKEVDPYNNGKKTDGTFEIDLMEQKYKSKQALLHLRQKFIIILSSILMLFAVVFIFFIWKNKKTKEEEG